MDNDLPVSQNSSHPRPRGGRQIQRPSPHAATDRLPLNEAAKVVRIKY